MPGRTAVLYRPLPGRTLLQMSRDEGFSWDIYLPRLIELIRQLHRSGVYFRSLHLGNVVVTPDQRLGLIDVADMRFLRPPLSARMIRRNVQHMVRYIERENLGERFPSLHSRAPARALRSPRHRSASINRRCRGLAAGNRGHDCVVTVQKR